MSPVRIWSCQSGSPGLVMLGIYPACGFSNGPGASCSSGDFWAGGKHKVIFYSSPLVLTPPWESNSKVASLFKELVRRPQSVSKRAGDVCGTAGSHLYLQISWGQALGRPWVSWVPWRDVSFLHKALPENEWMSTACFWQRRNSGFQRMVY
jgi:hypothetical protein